MPSTLILLCLISPDADPEVDARRFGSLMQGLHAQIRDLTFAFEGGLRAGDGARAAGADVGLLPQDYQGRYSYRFDGAELLDLYVRGLRTDDRQSHSLYQNLGGYSSVTVVPDQNRLIPIPPPGNVKSLSNVRPSSLGRPGCPVRIVYPWFFHGLTDPSSMRYEFQGWENVDGRRCLRVELDFESFGPLENRDRVRMWVDMARGGNPLRVDQLRGGRLFARSRNIELRRFQDAKQATVWLPISGQFETFIWASMPDRKILYYADPIRVETYKVITGSVVLNQGLSDADLSIGPNAKKYIEFNGFNGFQKERRTAIRSDPKSVQKRLDQTLADADSRAVRLEASAPERVSLDWFTVLSLGFSALGVVLLFFAGIYRWRWTAR